MRLRVSIVRNLSFASTIWLLLAAYYLHMGDKEALLLWLTLPIPFGFMFWVALRSGHLILSLFMGGIFLSHAVLPSYFFLERDLYTYSGWRAVRSFNFNIFYFLQIYLQVFFYVAVVLVVSLRLQPLVIGYFKPRSRIWNQAKGSSTAYLDVNTSIDALRTSVSRLSPPRRKTRLVYGFLLIAVILMVAILNNWMYSRGIAMTGLIGTQERLPFRLTGILYYFTRFIVPIVIALIYIRTPRSWFFAFAILIYAVWAGSSQVSRTTFMILWLIIPVFALIDRRYVILASSAISLIIVYPLIGLARNEVYYLVENVAYGETSTPLFRLIWQVLRNYDISYASTSFFSLIGRLGGAQDVVLASQYDTAAMGGNWAQFQRVFLFGTPISGSAVAMELFGFVPPSGFSPGSGGLSSMVLQIAGGNWLVLCLVAIWLAVLLTIGEKLVQVYILMTGEQIIGLIVGGFYFLFLYAFGHISWLYGFLFSATLLLGVRCVSRLGKRGVVTPYG